MDIITSIDQAITKRALSKPHRNYLGASSLGEPCDRKLWYSYHKPIRISDPRINRIFDLGNLIEDYLVGLLKEAGYEVFVKDEDGKQFGFEDEEIAGSSDGVIIVNDVPMLLEFKSYNTKRFAELKKMGVKNSAPIYFTQTNVYMKYLELESCLFIAMDKNTSELHIEIIDYDPIEANWAVNRGKEIVREKDVNNVAKKYNHISTLQCKFCDHQKICWGKE